MTLRVAIGWPLESGRYAADSLRRGHAYVALRRRGRDAFVLFTHSAWVWRVWPGAIRWLGSDLRSGQRRAYRPNMPAPEFRRERPPLVFGKLGGHCSRSVSSHFRRLSCAPPSRRRVPSLLHTVTALAATTGVCSLASVDGSMGHASGNGTADIRRTFRDI